MYSFVLLLNWYMYIYTTYKLLLCYINYLSQTNTEITNYLASYSIFLKITKNIYPTHLYVILHAFCGYHKKI